MGSNFAGALIKVQAELKPIRRTATGNRGKYADLAAIEEAVFPLLAGAGLAWTTKTKRLGDGRWVLRGKLIHAESGEREQADWPLAATGGQQQLGSEVTYGRRYLLCAMVGAAPEGEDDDADAAGPAEVGQGGGRAWRRETPADRPSRPVTRTKVTGKEHEQLRHGTVEATPDDRPAQRAKRPGDDEWTDQPATVAPTVKVRTQAIIMHFDRLEVTDRDERLALTATLAGWPEGKTLNSTNDLGNDQADKVLRQLSKLKNYEALIALVTKGEKQDA